MSQLNREDEWELVNTHSETYPSTFTQYDNVLPNSWIEEWQTTDSICDGTTQYGCGPDISREDITDGSGNIVGQKVTKRCYIGETPRCNNDPNCNVTSYECTREQDGLCVKQEQTYTCREDGKCDPSSYEIMPEVSDDEGAFSDAIAAAGVMDMIAAEGGLDENLRIFSGLERECKAITSDFRRMMEFNATVSTVLATYFGGPLGAVLAGTASADILNAIEHMECCQDDPEDVVLTSSFISMATGIGADYCDLEDVELAAARMAKRAVQVTPGFVPTNNTLCTFADYIYNAPAKGDMSYAKQICSHWTRPWSMVNTQTQVDDYQRWCEFDSMLARIIQEQGRDQLAVLASQNAGGAVTKRTEFAFYNSAGGWTDELNVNGNRVRFWQWKEECSTDEGFTNSMLSGYDCPSSPDIYAVACSESSCGAPPDHPVYGFSPGWETHRLEAEDHHTRAINRYSVVEGGCFDDGSCEYKVHAWKAGAGGQMRIPLDMKWPINFPNDGWGEFSWAHNNVHFEAFTNPLGTESPTRGLRMCIGSSYQCRYDAAWNEVNIQNDIANLNNYVSNSPPVTLTGGCSAEECEFRASIEVNLTAKPWYTYSEKKYEPCMLKVLGSCVTKASTTYDRQYTPDCTGFTIDEFLALDLGDMDFSEYVETLSEKAKSEFNQTWAR
ncbi:MULTISPECIES: conjugal transfer protein TraN [Halomonadaceae]|uniref:conjugal transfer protein TraN n=1 Tax=Halomonadaceae TaxID=28256 RepID=UPI001376344B|nr:conjugal transfer protein TraN [Halomonas sp. HAL1]WKV95140.1 conjugal transfer protein TraN [Halomonas sp. HAL1]